MFPEPDWVWPSGTEPRMGRCGERPILRRSSGTQKSGRFRIPFAARPIRVPQLERPGWAKQKDAAVAQLVRASAFQAEGCGFESRLPLHEMQNAE